MKKFHSVWGVIASFGLISGCQSIKSGPEQAAVNPPSNLTSEPRLMAAVATELDVSTVAVSSETMTDAETALAISPFSPNPPSVDTESAIAGKQNRSYLPQGSKNQQAAAPAQDLWQITRDNFALDLDSKDPRVAAQLKWYAKHPRYINRVVDRAGRYYHYVLHEVINQGVPAEIALLPIVESAYDPFAYSHGRAAGPWQFIPGTAKHFGLKKSWWYDGRRDIQASTQAAITYLKQLNTRFDGDWLLALAAYNAGGGNVNKAIRKNRKRNLPIDFYSLQLPKETSAYVPKLIALAKIFKEPAKYGVTLKPIDNKPYFTAVDIGSQIDLAQAAELADISIDELYLLNPGFNQWATDPEGPHQLLVPVEKAESFNTALAKLPKAQRVTWKRYKIMPGDSLISIAKRHKTTVSTLRTANSIRGNNIRAGQVMLIPTASSPAGAYALSSGQRQVKKSQRIALRSGKSKVQYKVRSGDSFWTIARKYGVGVRQLASWNQMAPGDPLRVGKKLTIWQKTASTLAKSSSPNVVRKVGYRVRNGDSLSRIASRFKVRVKDIKRWNTLGKSKYLQPGQQLTLYVDVTRAR
ncbi:MAG: LysM peptidoglycan-binding domain-containing protein [Motiliproteus sp.]|nr:LysM peptidoglycan-binding domain-containing protein [Motiliproteus sp.]MCW9052673.1 LysM peptidoglycan-binding domain-containing protein [Motiliproteus sp.]